VSQAGSRGYVQGPDRPEPLGDYVPTCVWCGKDIAGIDFVKEPFGEVYYCGDDCVWAADRADVREPDPNYPEDEG